ncbi:MAG TPA: hypothetical protein VN325_38135 [Steroidobacteraceae bacterium]|nr:hypothetical protein [Steroidobacteraceae bacterium]
MKVKDASTDWEFECLTDSSGNALPGGLVLKSVLHNGHNFAKDLRLIGFKIETELVDPSGTITSSAPVFYALGAAPFAAASVRNLIPVTVTLPAPAAGTFQYLKEADTALDFARYFKDPAGNYVGVGVAATYKASGFFSALPNCEYSDLEVEQIFLFSRYSNAPPHEPSGGLVAARFLPMTRYALTANSAVDKTKPYTRLKRIRFDYRFQLYLDRHYDVATNATLAQLGNQAGLFADSDSSVGSGIKGVGSGIWNVFNSGTAATAVTSGAFVAVEKPVVLEVTAPGLGAGFPLFENITASGTKSTVRGWDNVHWWGANLAGAPLISTPGAFHCAHLHWRWGGAAPGVGSNTVFNPTVYPAGMPTKSAMKGMWGPVLDPGIWMQSIRVAIVKNDPKLDPNKGVALKDLSNDQWEKLFDPSLRATPIDIEGGDEIVMWFSSEIPQRLEVTGDAGWVSAAPKATYTAKPSGTVFIHGFFFAHDSERSSFAKVGSRDPAHWPMDEAGIRSAKKWFRPAK